MADTEVKPNGIVQRVMAGIAVLLALYVLARAVLFIIFLFRGAE